MIKTVQLSDKYGKNTYDKYVPYIQEAEGHMNMIK